jgi:hypothetical protein
MSVPCVLARTLAEARRILQSQGVPVLAIEETAPPHGRPAGPLRVVRQRVTGEGVQLVAAASVPLAEGRDCHE